MKEYKCKKCDKEFKKKSHLQDHLNKKNPCDKLPKNAEDLIRFPAKMAKKADVLLDKSAGLPRNDEDLGQVEFDRSINNKTMNQYLNTKKCIYCLKTFAKKNNVIYHIKHNCKKIKEIENEKHAIFMKLKEFDEMKKQLELATSEMKEIKDMLAKNNQTILPSNTTNNINNNNDSSITDNSTHNYQQNINLVGYNKEDYDKIDKEDIVKATKRGYMTPVELTRAIHLNPKYPEYHNIYIPRINEKYAMVYKNGIWTLMDKNKLADDLHDNKKNYVEENLEEFLKSLDSYKKKSLKKWLETEEDDQAIINTKEEIKFMLYENKQMVLDHRRAIEKELRGQKKLKHK